MNETWGLTDPQIQYISCLSFSEIGEGDKWVGEIYPGMRDAIIHVLQVSQDTIDDRKVRKFMSTERKRKGRICVW